MGSKVNFNKKKNNKLLKLVFIIGLVLLVLVILIKSFIDVKNSMTNNQSQEDKALVYQKIEEYETIKNLIESYDCRFIKSETVDGIEKIYVDFDVNLYSGSVSNENHFLNICKGVAQFLKYKNFELIDTNKNIDIEVKCEEPNIVEFKINGDINYYLTHDSNANKTLSTSITEFPIQSKELQDLIDNNWDESKVDWGTRETTCNGYNIYFDEGIYYKIVARNVFNVIFTENYEKSIAAGLSAKSTPGEVEKYLGKPTFQYNDDIYGYIGNDNYLFFDFLNNQVSVYPVVEVTKDDEEKLKELIKEMNNTSDIKDFASKITLYWTDFDVYDYDSNYVDLRYTLRGIQLSINLNSLKNGLFIYQNYSGNRNIDELENVYITGDNFVFEEEKDRSLKESMYRIEIGDFTDEYFESQLGKDFSVRFNVQKTVENPYFKGIRFYSRDKSYPDSELDKNLEISSYTWYDDYQIIYSINDDGLYIYNCRSRINLKIVDLEGEIELKEAGDGQIVYNDNQVINVSIE